MLLKVVKRIFKFRIATVVIYHLKKFALSSLYNGVVSVVILLKMDKVMKENVEKERSEKPSNCKALKNSEN